MKSLIAEAVPGGHPKPIWRSVVTTDARDQRRRGTVKHHSPKENERSFASWVSAHAAHSIVFKRLRLDSTSTLRGSRFPR